MKMISKRQILAANICEWETAVSDDVYDTLDTLTLRNDDGTSPAVAPAGKTKTAQVLSEFEKKVGDENDFEKTDLAGE